MEARDGAAVMSDLAVIVVSWNVRDLLAACLRSLHADLERAAPGAQVWVVDNASSDGTPDMVSALFPDARLEVSQENLGFAAGNNLALQQVLASRPRPPKYVWLLNPDTEVLSGATTACVSALEGNSRAAVAGAKLLHTDGSLQHSAFRFPGLAQLAFELFSLPPRFYETGLNGRYPRRLYAGDAPFQVDHPLGASMMVRTEAISHVGLMDDEYRMYCEEIDWCWRMRRAGWRALCVPTAHVVHHAGRSTAQVPVDSFLNLWTSRARLYARYQGAFAWRLARMMLRAGMRRRMRSANPEMAAACRQIVRIWGEIR
jgi:N-acetylglucosaminyl-diphospho-decaprenol L-rhamnosyltransferase